MKNKILYSGGVDKSTCACKVYLNAIFSEKVGLERTVHLVRQQVPEFNVNALMGI